MPDAFDQLNDTPQHPTTPMSATPTAAVPSSTQRDIFDDDTPTQAPTVVAQNGAGRRPDIFDEPSSGDAFDQLDAHEKVQADAQAAAAKVAQHGILRRAWDFVNSPIADLSVAGHRLLPEGVKTSDIIKAAAFEKMYGEAYIPGYNDFDTKAESQLGPAPAKMTTKDGHPYVATPESHAFKNALRTFIAGVGKDSSDMAAGFTSPVGIATTLAGVGPEAKAGSALAKAAPIAKALVGTAFGAKGVHDIYEAGTENTPEAWQQRLQGASMVAGGAAASSEAAGDIAGRVSNSRAATATKNFVAGGQTKLQPAIRGAAQTAADLGAARPAIELTEAAHPNVPAEYQDLVNEAMKQGPSWTPAKAKPIAHALGDDFEVRGSVGEGKPSNNDLDIWAKGSDFSDAAPKLEQLGFKKVADTSHGETWTNEATGQNVDLWDSEHEPIKGHGPDTEETEGADGGEQKLVGKTVAGAPAVKVKPTASIRTALGSVADDIEGRGKQIYQALDRASDNKFTTFSDRLNRINDRLDQLIPDTTEADDSAIDRLEQQKSEIETSQAQLFENLKNSGIDPTLVDSAKAHWKQSMALRDVDRALNTSTTGNTAYGAKEVVDSGKLVTRLEKLNVSRNGQPSRLAQALGKDGADALMKDAYEAVKTKQNLRYVKWGAAIAGGLGLLKGQLHNLTSWAGAMLP